MKIQALLLAVVLIFASEAAARDCSSPGDYVPVRTVAELQSIGSGEGALSGSYILCNSLSLAGVEFHPIGTEAAPFRGRFDGGGFAITDLKPALVPPAPPALGHAGLFGVVMSGRIERLRVSRAEIDAPAGWLSAGILAGWIGRESAEASPAVLLDIEVDGSVNASDYHAGLVAGMIMEAHVESVRARGSVRNSYGGAGAIAHLLYDSSAMNVQAVDTIVAASLGDKFCAGGLFGRVFRSDLLEGFFSGVVEEIGIQLFHVGGIVGCFEGLNHTISGMRAEAAVRGGVAGGIVGYISRAVVDSTVPSGPVVVLERSSFEGSVESASLFPSTGAGGVAGFAEFAELRELTADAAVQGTVAGGMIARMRRHTRLVDVAARGAVAGSTLSGGAVAMGPSEGPAEINRSYAAANLSGGGWPGGLVAQPGDGPEIDRSYFDVTLAPHADNGIGAPATTVAMQTGIPGGAGEFAEGWSESAWRFCAGRYPELRKARAGPLDAADMTRDGRVMVDDIFAFLSAWFAGDSRTDIDGSCTIGAPDIFAFLSRWFAES